MNNILLEYLLYAYEIPKKPNTEKV